MIVSLGGGGSVYKSGKRVLIKMWGKTSLARIMGEGSEEVGKLTRIRERKGPGGEKCFGISTADRGLSNSLNRKRETERRKKAT